MSTTKRCPYCAEEILAEAVRCRHCRSRLATFAEDHWHRAHEEGRLGGVCAALSRALAVPLPLVRLAFIVLTIFLHVAPLVYVALWLVIPPTIGAASHLETGLDRALDLVRSARRPGPGGPHPDGDRTPDVTVDPRP